MSDVGDPDIIIVSSAPPAPPAPGSGDVLNSMGVVYRANPTKAVRGQSFITLLHQLIGAQLEVRLTRFARRRRIRITYESTILSATKPKAVDVAVIDPDNGPLMLIGVRSQMSSVGNNVLGYYEGIVGECTSLQEWFPMAVHGYVYLHPLHAIKQGERTRA